MSAPSSPSAERRAFSLLIALLLGPVLAQGLDRPLAHGLGGVPSGAPVTVLALATAFVAWSMTTWRPSVALAGTTAFAVAAGLGLALGTHPPALVALGVAAFGTASVAAWLPGWLPPALDGAARRRPGLTVVYVLLALGSVVQVSRVSVFIADPTRVDAQVVPGLDFLETHSCLTAYVHADELAHDRVHNLYDAERWPWTIEIEERPQTPFSPFDIDAYFYPPPFLLFVEPVMTLRGDFLAQRALWFCANALLLMGMLGLGAKRLGGPRWHRPLLLAPLFGASIPVLVLVQVGNVQGTVSMIAVLSMYLLARGRGPAGGFLLGVAILAKVSPGIFGIVLLARRRWSDAAWTAAAGGFLLVASVLAYGTDPLVSWVTYALPRISSGQAFADILAHPDSVVINLAPFGWPFKLPFLGVEVDDPWAVGAMISKVYTLLLLAAAVILGYRQAGPASEDRSGRAMAWMALLFLMALRSPYAPGYVQFALLWAMTLLSVEVERRWQGWGLVLAALVVAVVPPMSHAAVSIYLLLTQVTAIGLSAWLVLRRRAYAAD